MCVILGNIQKAVKNSDKGTKKDLTCSAKQLTTEVIKDNCIAPPIKTNNLEKLVTPIYGQTVYISGNYTFGFVSGYRKPLFLSYIV